MVRRQLGPDTVYAFLIDWINVQRGLGVFFALMSEKEREDLILPSA